MKLFYWLVLAFLLNSGELLTPIYSTAGGAVADPALVLPPPPPPADDSAEVADLALVPPTAGDADAYKSSDQADSKEQDNATEEGQRVDKEDEKAETAIVEEGEEAAESEVAEESKPPYSEKEEQFGV